MEITNEMDECKKEMNTHSTHTHTRASRNSSIALGNHSANVNVPNDIFYSVLDVGWALDGLVSKQRLGGKHFYSRF